MAWMFELDCPDCGHHWKGCVVSLHVGPYPWADDETQSLFCPRCFNDLHFAQTLDRKRWQTWHTTFLARRPLRPEWVLGLLAHIDTQFPSGPWYRPRQLDPGVVNCPECSLPMVPGGRNSDHVCCPKCRSLSPVLFEFTGRMCLLHREDGFS